MIDLSTLSPEVMLARGQYSTVRSAHEDEKKRLQILCGSLSAKASNILRHLQPDYDKHVEGDLTLGMLLTECRSLVDQIEQCGAEIESLAKQRADLKPLAWG